MYEVDELANIVAMASEKEQVALTEDIKVNGQNQPAVLWGGKIVDGRCRQLACVTLGIELDVRELDAKLTRDEVARVVKSLNTRRNLTITQKIMSGVKEQERTGDTNVETAKKWAISEKTFKNGKYVAKYRPEFVETLFDGKTVTVFDPDKGFDVTTNKVNTIARLIKKQKEVNVIEDISEKIEIEWTADGVLKTEKAKDWYYTKLVEVQTDPSGVTLGRLLVEMANLKFKVESDE